MFNETIPGQNAPPDNYAKELAAIVKLLQAFSASTGAKLAWVQTTPYLCTAKQDGCVQNLNNQARAIMAAANIPVVDAYSAVVSQCGPAPKQACFGARDCFCPHCNDKAYRWLAENVVAPAIRAMLA